MLVLRRSYRYSFRLAVVVLNIPEKEVTLFMNLCSLSLRDFKNIFISNKGKIALKDSG